MTTDDASELDRWLDAQQIGEELNEVVVLISLQRSFPALPPLSKELRHDQYL